MLPGGDGMDICRRLRAEHGVTVPILLLTARAEESDRVAGLNVGADDYVVKPFSPAELVARVRAHLRRVEIDTTAPPPTETGVLSGGDIRLDPQNRTVEVLDLPVNLTSKEFDLLHFLMAHPGQTYSRDQLLDEVWDRDYFGDASTVTVHIRRLREKIEPPWAADARQGRVGRGLQVRSVSMTRAASRPLVVGLVLLLAIVLAAVVAERLMGAPRGDVVQLAIFLSVSGIASLLIGAAAVLWASHRLGSLRDRLTIAFGAGLLVAVANVLTTSALMFINPHDLSLLFLLFAFSAVITMTFAFTIAGALTVELEKLGDVATRLAHGDLTARVHPIGTDEVARVGQAFDDMAERLEAAFERQRAMERARRDLVASVSHDLRTPLATTRAMVEALSDGVVAEPSEVRRYLGLIHREIQHLSRLIDDLFELSHIESGALELKLDRVDVRRLAIRALAAYEAGRTNAALRSNVASPRRCRGARRCAATPARVAQPGRQRATPYTIGRPGRGRCAR
jgi:DNA-binding response OmpR family regulator/HAMP domain-containing protein